MSDSLLRAGTRYAAVAAHLADTITRGTYRPGERLPSVRALARQTGASINTVIEAYRVLTRDGVVENRPQSGHFVRTVPSVPVEPGLSRPASAPSAVAGSEIALRMLRDARDPALRQLGAAIPHPDQLPLAQLDRILLALARERDVASYAYDMPPGHRGLRVQVARRLAALGCAVGPDDVVTTTGGMEALTLCLRAICKPGDVVALESPAYYGVLQCLEALGLRALEIPTHPRDGISLAALGDALDEHTVAAVVAQTNFNNPLGSRMSEPAKRELVELLAARDIPLIEDDIYGDLVHDGERPGVAKAHDRRGLVLLCGSFSKTVAPGLRVGWLVGGRWNDRIQQLKSTSTIASATLPQAVVAELLASGDYDRHLRRIRPRYAASTAVMGQAVARSFPPGTCVTRPNGGYVLWVEMPEEVDALKLYELAIAAGITIAPGPLFSAKQRYRHFVRLNAAWWSAELADAVDELGRIAHRLHGHAGRRRRSRA